MLNVTVANIGELAVVGCEGRIIQSESAYKLREAVTSQTDSRIIVVELSEVRAIGGGGLGMLAFLERWAREHNIRFLLFHPSKAVEGQLKHAKSIAEFYIASLEEMKAPLAYANSRYAVAAWRTFPAIVRSASDMGACLSASPSSRVLTLWS